MKVACFFLVLKEQSWQKTCLVSLVKCLSPFHAKTVYPYLLLNQVIQATSSRWLVKNTFLANLRCSPRKLAQTDSTLPVRLAGFGCIHSFIAACRTKDNLMCGCAESSTANDGGYFLSLAQPGKVCVFLAFLKMR